MAQNHNSKPTEIDAKQIVIDDKVADLSFQKRAEGADVGGFAGGNFADTMWFVRQYNDALVAPWWSEQRDADLRAFILADGNDILQGAISSLIKKIKALPWFLEGPQRVTRKYQQLIANAEFGQGWSIFLSKLLYDYLSQDKGGFVEFIGDGKPEGPIVGPVLGLAHLDAALCQLTGDTVYPVLYRNPKDDFPHKLHATRVGHIVDTPSPSEVMNNIGFCSTSRVVASSNVLLKLAQYKNEKLDDLPEAGLLLFNNLMPAKWEDAHKNYQRERRRMAQNLWSPIMTLFGIDPAQPVTAQLISFSNLPENFNELDSTNIYVNIVALAFGVDVREFWPMSGGSLGTATETEVMHQKAKGKGVGEIISSLERLVNWYMLPENVTFKFDVQDDEEDKLKADINKIKVDSIMAMWKPPGAAELAAGSIAPVTPIEIRQMLADNVPYFNKEFLTVDLTDEVTVDDVDQEEADDITKAYGQVVTIDHKGVVTVPHKVKRLTETGKVLAQAEKNFKEGKISLDDLIEFRLGAVLDSQDFFKSFPEHAGRPGQVGGSRAEGTLSGSQLEEYTNKYSKIKGDSKQVRDLSKQFLMDSGLSDAEAESVFSDGSKWVNDFNMSTHPFQDDIRNATPRAVAIHQWNQVVLKSEGKTELELYRGVNKTQVRQMDDNKQGSFTFIGIRPGSSWSESRSIAKEHSGWDGAIIKGKFPGESSFMSSKAFPTVFGKNYEHEHIMIAGKQEGGLRWLRLRGSTVAEEKAIKEKDITFIDDVNWIRNKKETGSSNIVFIVDTSLSDLLSSKVIK